MSEITKSEQRISEIEDVAYKVFEKFNDFNLSVGETEIAIEYMSK